MSSNTFFKDRIQSWQIAVCFGVCAYLALGVATNTVRAYHWCMLLAVPAALAVSERGRSWFMDWAPLFAFWLVYDRLRLVQPLLYSRVSVDHPLEIEKWVFGWAAKGAVPAHAAHAWFRAHPGAFAVTIEWTAQVIYFSHLFVAPLVILSLWTLGVSRERYRAAFLQHIRAFTLLNFAAIVLYLILPVAPPWWVTLYGKTQPTAELVAQANIAAAMHGKLICGMIANASHWFAAVPSLHGGYPVLLLLLGWKTRSRRALAGLAVYGTAMWMATVILNQHYIVDLLAGAVLAIAAFCAARSRRFARVYKLGLCRQGCRERGSHTTLASRPVAPREKRSSEN